MKLTSYKTFMRACEMAISTFGNQEMCGPLLFVDIAPHCEWLEVRFFKVGWATGKDEDFRFHVTLECNEDKDIEKLNNLLDIAEGEIKAWEKLNKEESKNENV